MIIMTMITSNGIRTEMAMIASDGLVDVEMRTKIKHTVSEILIRKRSSGNNSDLFL